MRVMFGMCGGAMSIVGLDSKRGTLSDMEEARSRLHPLLMGRAHLGPWSLHGGVFRRDSRKRLNWKTQCQQQDDEESAANRHRGAV